MFRSISIPIANLALVVLAACGAQNTTAEEGAGLSAIQPSLVPIGTCGDGQQVFALPGAIINQCDSSVGGMEGAYFVEVKFPQGTFCGMTNVSLDIEGKGGAVCKTSARIVRKQ